ncbi:hypothetical protein ADK57_36205 [Streptomyces sp. MMG1533]|uniref:hypothetical protein n=1 Tax=Streptomyces sp. MMG1533 TaxID=1415546 RepID=UPI0006C70CBC|nr:hypothetical protein [Streptomyces sp. MMG1533]KOU58486.1 hypothetical protein ADK57_36205 [Streptomyces sp. MMG1533]
MPSVVGLLEQRELVARRRVDELREEADYQRILTVLGDRHRLHQGPLACQELAVMFGMDAVPAKAEALRSKAKRLVARGWPAERQPGRFTLAQGVAGQGGAS